MPPDLTPLPRAVGKGAVGAAPLREAGLSHHVLLFLGLESEHFTHSLNASNLLLTIPSHSLQLTPLPSNFTDTKAAIKRELPHLLTPTFAACLASHVPPSRETEVFVLWPWPTLSCIFTPSI